MYPLLNKNNDIFDKLWELSGEFIILHSPWNQNPHIFKARNWPFESTSFSLYVGFTPCKPGGTYMYVTFSLAYSDREV